MIVVVTEDSKAGFQFLRLISKIYYGNSVVVVSSKGYTGIEKTINEVVEQYKDKQLKVLIAYDKITRIDIELLPVEMINKIRYVESLISNKNRDKMRSKSRYDEYIDEFMRNIKLMLKSVNKLEGDMSVINEVADIIVRVKNSCKQASNVEEQLGGSVDALKRNNIPYEIVDYVCFEEIFLSFESLMEYCRNSVAGLEYSNNAIRTIELLRETAMSKGDKLGYYEVFKNNLVGRKMTLEKCLKTTLDRITKNENIDYFNINEAEIMPCWYIDCRVGEVTTLRGEKIQRNRELCKGCFVSNKKICLFDNKQTAINRFNYLIHNSIGIDIINKINMLRNM